MADRVAALGAVDLLDADTELNPLVPSMFAAVTAVFVVLVLVSRFTGRNTAVTEARLVFAQHGRLARPHVIGDSESEAILRGRLRPCMVLWMVTLQVGEWPAWAGWMRPP